MNFKVNATARLKATEVTAAPEGLDQLYSMFLKKIGSPPDKSTPKFSRTRLQVVSWHLGTTRSGQVTLDILVNLNTSRITLAYHGIADSVMVEGKDGKSVFSSFKKEALKWLDSGEATPEDREYLERIL
jgi:hypothetical protein